MKSYQNNNDNIRKMLPENVEDRIKEATQKIQRERQHERHAEEMRRVLEESRIRESEERKIKAVEETAANTEKTNQNLNEIINNQNEYIKTLKKQLEVSESQLQALRNLFVSLEDGVSVEKELARLVQTQIDETHPLWDYVKDKGGDVVIAGAPVLYNTLKIYLMSKGVLLP